MDSLAADILLFVLVTFDFVIVMVVVLAVLRRRRSLEQAANGS